MKAQTSPGINVHLYPTLSGHESRILRITDALAGWLFFTHIFLVGMASDQREPIESIDDARTICRLPVSFADSRSLMWRLLRFLSWYIAVLRRFGREPVSCVNAHSLSTLPLGWLLKLRTGAKLIYDTHELETETLNMKGARQRLAKIVEAIFIRSADAVIVVGPRIADWYRRAYRGIDPVVVRNLPIKPPDTTRLDLFRDRLRIKPTDLLFFYQGVLAEGRGIETTLAAFSKASTDRHVVFLGYGPMVEEIQEYSRRHPNIHFLPAVPPHEVRQYTQSGDIGLCLIEPKCLSYTYCMPNKLFEYLGAGVPAVVTSLPELATIISESGAGWTIENDADALLDTIMSIQQGEAPRRGALAVEWARRNSWVDECTQLRLPYVALGLTAKPLAPSSHL